MRSVIVVHPFFDHLWPFAADRFRELMAPDGDTELIRLTADSSLTLGTTVPNPETVVRLISLRVPVTTTCLDRFTALEETYIEAYHDSEEVTAAVKKVLDMRGTRMYAHPNEGFWRQSVSEFALALTLCGLRRIPQTHHTMITSYEPWDYSSPGGVGTPGTRGQQFGDDPCFANGTIEGKRIRIVGAGNISSRYASFVHMLGADVAAWDPYAAEQSFHLAGTRREWHLDRLVQDAEVFVPMLPLTDATSGLITADHIRALPKGTLVVLATRAGICDMEELRRRVMADELSLAADVFDVEPLPLDDPLLGRHNVVHTPHNAGRTKEANFQYAAKLYQQFLPR